MGVLSLGCFLVFALVGVIFLAVACSGSSRQNGPVEPGRALPYAAPAGYGNMQLRNNHFPAAGVHQVPSMVAAWPAMWVGPATEAAPSPVIVEAEPALVQRRRPSASAVRLTTHGSAR